MLKSKDREVGTNRRIVKPTIAVNNGHYAKHDMVREGEEVGNGCQRQQSQRVDCISVSECL